jgi:hypothetical protein
MKKIIFTLLLASLTAAMFTGCGYSRKSGCPAQDSLMRH